MCEILKDSVKIYLKTKVYVQDQLAKISTWEDGEGIKSHHLLRRVYSQQFPGESISFCDGRHLPIVYPTPIHTKWTLGFNRDHIKWKQIGLRETRERFERRTSVSRLGKVCRMLIWNSQTIKKKKIKQTNKHTHDTNVCTCVSAACQKLSICIFFIFFQINKSLQHVVR